MHIDLDNIFAVKVVTIIGGGPSLKGFDLSVVRHPFIVINEAVYSRMDADMLVAIDQQWQKDHNKKIEGYGGLRITDKEPILPGWVQLHYVKPMRAGSLDWMCQKVNLSGYTALTVAFLLGAVQVYLLGFDGGYAEGQDKNWYKGNPLAAITNDSYTKGNDYFGRFISYPVINVGMGSRIETFEKVPLNNKFYEAHVTV